MKIAWLYNKVAYGEHRAPLKWDSLEDTPAGLTGSDAVVVNYAREFAKRGHNVDLYCHNAGVAMPVDGSDGRPAVATYDGVTVYDYRQWDGKWNRDEPYDVAISLSNTDPLMLADAARTLRVVNRQVSRFGIDCHEHETHGFDAFVDLYTCPSEHARLHVSSGLPHPEKFRVVQNGVYPELFGGRAKRSGRVVYCSSPDRGLHRLLEVWPEVRRRVPHATLRVMYQSLDQWLAFHCDPAKRSGGKIDDECTRRALYVREGLRRLAAHGVEVVGKGLSHREVCRQLDEAEVFAFPCDVLAHTETFSVATLDAATAGCCCVITDEDCLGEVHGGAVAVVRSPVGERLGEFTDLVVRGLTDGAFRESMAALGRQHAAEHAWPKLAERYEAVLVESVERKKRGPEALYNLELGGRVIARTRSEVGTRVPRVEGGAPNRVRIDLVLTRYASGDEPIDVDRPFDSNSGGGCRAGFMGLVRELPRLGYDVRAWTNVTTDHGRVMPGDVCTKEGVEYHQLGPWQPGHPLPFEPRDVLMAYYDTSPLVGVPGGRTLRVASHHTFQLPNPGSVEWTDVNLAPSQYAVDALRTVYDTFAPWYCMPNAVQPDLPEWAPVPGRCVYHTSPSRGLHNLLEAWEEIKRRVPHASLHVIGDVQGWLAHYEGRGDRQARFADRVRDALAKLEGSDCGIRFLGRLTRARVLEELACAACFPFPFEATAPCETFSVSVAECLAIGVPVIVDPGDAMQEIYVDPHHEAPVVHVAGRGRLAEWVPLALRGELGPRSAEVGLRRRQEFGRSFTFPRKAAVLDRAIRENLGGRWPADSASDRVLSRDHMQRIAELDA